MITISFDIDWSPDWIVDDVVNTAERRNVPLTLYCTDPATDRSGNSSSLRGRYSGAHELGLHPNFQHRGDYDAVWSALFALYPEARGFRSHQGVTGFPIVQTGARRGLTYEASTAIAPVFVPPFHPFARELAGFTQVPTAFMDHQAFRQRNFHWDVNELAIAKDLTRADRLYVFCFHPNIVHYDLGSEDAYDIMRPNYHALKPQSSVIEKPAAARKLYNQLVNSFDPSDFVTVFDGINRLAATS